MCGGSPWSRAETVAGFAQSPPNETLMAFAAAELRRLRRHSRAVDLGCGAGRNAVPLAQAGWNVVGIDLSWPMLLAAHDRRTRESVARPLRFVRGVMDAVPVQDACADLVIAHGIWNLARSAVEFRRAVAEAARVSLPDAALFVFTFSRNTLPPATRSLDGEPFVFDAFSGEAQCFLTERQLLDELAAHGFAPDPGAPLRELNLPRPGMLQTAGVPVIYEGAFRHQS